MEGGFCQSNPINFSFHSLWAFFLQAPSLLTTKPASRGADRAAPTPHSIAGFEMLIDGKKIAEYQATTRIYFDIEREG
jgi:hypothetical protein